MSNSLYNIYQNNKPDKPIISSENPNNKDMHTQKNLFLDFEGEIEKSKQNINSIDNLSNNFLINNQKNKLNIKIKKINEKIKIINEEMKKLNTELNEKKTEYEKNKEQLDTKLNKKIDKEKDFLLVINWLEIIIKVTAYNLKEKQPLQITEQIVDDYINNYLSSENNNQTGGSIIENGKKFINFVTKPFKPDKTQEEMEKWMERSNGDINLNENHFKDDEKPYYERERYPENRDSSNSTQPSTNKTSESHSSSSRESDPNPYHDKYEYLKNYESNSNGTRPINNKEYKNNYHHYRNSSITTQPSSTESTSNIISLPTETSGIKIMQNYLIDKKKPNLNKNNKNVIHKEFLNLFFDTIENRLMKILNYEIKDKYTKDQTKELIKIALNEDDYFKKIIKNSLNVLNTQTAKGGTKTRRKQNALRHNPKRTKRRIQTPPPSLKTTKQQKQKAQYQNISRRTKNKPKAKHARKTKNNNKH